jgi:hypothetical protein
MTVALGAVLFAMGALTIWFSSEDKLICRAADRTCVVQQDFLLRPSERSEQGPGHPLKFTVEEATIGKNGRGQALVLIPESGHRVTIARAYSVSNEVRRLGEFSLSPSTDLLLTRERDWGLLVAMGLMPIAVGLLFLLSPLFRVRHYLVADPERKTISIELRFWRRVMRRAVVPVATGRVTIGTTTQFRGRPSRVPWLTLAPDQGEPRPIGLVDTPINRDALEAALRLVTPPAFGGPA